MVGKKLLATQGLKMETIVNVVSKLQDIASNNNEVTQLFIQTMLDLSGILKSIFNQELVQASRIAIAH